MSEDHLKIYLELIELEMEIKILEQEILIMFNQQKEVLTSVIN